MGRPPTIPAEAKARIVLSVIAGKQVHLGLVSPAIPIFQTTETLPDS